MAKIIGRKKVKKQYKAICKHCGAIIVFDEHELCGYSGIQRLGHCPLCHNLVYFDEDDIYDDGGPRECGNFCNHFKNGKCTYEGTDWRECPLS